MISLDTSRSDTDTDIREKIESLAEYCMSEIAQCCESGSGQVASPSPYLLRRIRGLASAGLALHSAGRAMMYSPR